ncbi:MAG: ABC transporter permease [Chloroflexi bacterium]|nr:ABC transporter permease [Chloroflexota bacterium]
MGMRMFILRRVLLAIPTLGLVTVLVFMMIRILPGDALTLMLGELAVNRPLSDLAAMKAELGFDKPLYEQYFRFVGGALKGDLGASIWDKEPVIDKIMSRLPVTVELALLAMVISIIIAVPIGVISAIRQDTVLDYVLRSLAIGFLSVPSFFLATLVVVLPAIWFRWTPPLRYVAFTDDPVANITQLMIPAMILGSLLAATVMRMTRTMMLEVMRQDYVRTAWAKGLTERAVVMRHALKNALIPVVTIMGLQVAFLIGGTIILESIFSLPGMGRLMIDAINFRDYPVIQGINLVVGIWVVGVNLIIDISYGFLDPRIRV